MNRVEAHILDGSLRRDTLERLLASMTIVAPILCLVLATVVYYWLDSWLAARFVVLYVAPMALVAPWWIRERIRSRQSDLMRPIPRLVDATVLLLAMARFGIGEMLPFSGHMLFLTHTALTTRARRYQAVAAALIVETTIFKLWIWQDARTWAIGLTGGLLTALIHKISTRRAQ